MPLCKLFYTVLHFTESWTYFLEDVINPVIITWYIQINTYEDEIKITRNYSWGQRQVCWTNKIYRLTNLPVVLSKRWIKTYYKDSNRKLNFQNAGILPNIQLVGLYEIFTKIEFVLSMLVYRTIISSEVEINLVMHAAICQNHPFYTIPYMYASFDRIDFLNTNDSQILSVRWTTTYPLQMAADMVRLNTFHMKESTSWVTSDRQVYAWICFETETSFTAFLWVSDIEIWIFRFCCGILSMHSSVNVESGSYEKFFIDVIKMTPNINIIFFVFLIEKCQGQSNNREHCQTKFWILATHKIIMSWVTTWSTHYIAGYRIE